MAAHAFSLQVTRSAKAMGRVPSTAPSRIAGWLCMFRTSVARAGKAHALRRELASLPQDTQRDTGLPPEAATGISTYQPDLPFFMQSRFGEP